MKRFLVFAGPAHYPASNLGDYHGAFDDIDTAKDMIKTMEAEAKGYVDRVDWAVILDCYTGIAHHYEAEKDIQEFYVDGLVNQSWK